MCDTAAAIIFQAIRRVAGGSSGVAVLTHNGRFRAVLWGPAIIAVVLVAASGSSLHAGGRRMLAREQAQATTPPAAPPDATTPSPGQDQLVNLYAKIQGENDKIIDSQGQIADDLDRNANLLGVTIGVGVVLMALFAAILMTTRRATKASAAAARALPTLERAYVFLSKDLAVTLPESLGPSAAVRLVFHASMTNHGRTPAVLRWVNLERHFLAEPPLGVYEEHERHGAGIVIGAGDSHRLADSPLTIPRSEWQRAETGDGAIYFNGRIVYSDIFGAQHETCFCWRYDIQGRAFVVVESEALNRYD